ncbi:MAG: GspH/FimT family protein [Patescibacteria group bacterium]
MHHLKGFNLPEIAVVIAIICILALIGIPSTRLLLPGYQLTSASRDIASELRYAAQQAVTEQLNYVVKFNTTTNQYSLYRIPDPEQPDVEEFIEQKDLPDSVTYQSITNLTDNEVRYNSAGAPSESGQISLINTRDTTKLIDIRPSGYVKIE